MKLVGILVLAALGVAGCGDTLGDDCRGAPGACGGGLFCCTEGKCGQGTCTAGCATDRDCPGSGVCEGRLCWRPCASDRDCAGHLRCKRKDDRLMCRGD